MRQKLRAFLAADVFPTICYLVSAFFVFAFFLRVGFPPLKELDATAGVYLALALFQFALPEAKRLKLGHVFEYEAKVKEIKEDVKQFKEETRAALSICTSLVSAISNTVNQNITVNVPGQAEAAKAREDLDATLKNQPDQDELESQIEELLESGASDHHYALARLRMEMERELRRVLAKRPESASIPDQTPRFLSARSLFTEFVRQRPQYGRMSSSFNYVLGVCNAAIHGHPVSDSSATEALSMGLSMLSELRTI